ncbi:SCO family protein [Burkholderia sp. Ac-20365]|nr:SCO family protein [Burkholderia sp. Ac-20365]
MDTHKRVLSALILTGAGLAAQAAFCADAQQPPAADAEMAAHHQDASMKMDEASGDDAIANAVANENDNPANDPALAGMSAKQRVMKQAAASAASKEKATQAAATDEAHAMPAGMPMPAAHESNDADDANHAKAPATATPTQDESKDEQHSMSGETDMHAHHHDMAMGTTRTTADYALPPVTLVRDDGKSVSLTDELNDGRPVVLTFIYTSCTTICPMVSETFEQLQEQLGSERDKVHLVSISIDPEEDTPARLKSYAARFDAGPEWQYYTGTVDASVAAQRAFNVYRGDKMNHTAVAFLRAAPGKPWLRLDGLATPDELLSAYHEIVDSNGS